MRKGGNSFKSKRPAKRGTPRDHRAPMSAGEKSGRGGAPRAKGGALAGGRVRGTVQGSGRGYAFLIPEDGSGDIFIASENMGDAIHGDIAEAVVIGGGRKGRECRVVKVLRRTHAFVVGVFDGKYVNSRDRGFGRVLVDRRGSLPAPVGKVVAARLEKTDILKCRVTEILGDEEDADTGVRSVIRSYGLSEEFPRAVERECAAIPDEVSEAEAAAKGRKDFRGDVTVTIDGAHSKDFDDAICVTREGEGYRLGVHIADVAHYVAEGSALDGEAMERGTSVYFADRVIPMLPEKLSNGICSLNEGADRLTLGCIMDFDGEGNRTGYCITEGVIRSKARLTYDEAEAIVNGDEAVCAAKPRAVVEMLTAAAELARLLKSKRAERGSVEFDLAECEIEMNPDGTVADVKKAGRLFSHELIEEFMLAANEAVAERFYGLKTPFVYRVHEAPPAEKTEALNEFLAAFGLSVPASPRPADYRALMEEANDDIKEAVGRVALRSMSKADYRPTCSGHFGLAARFYCHFTSPIRRYPDLAIHRIIKYVLHGGEDAEKKFGEFVVSASKRSSEREKIADEAERAADDFLKARFMQGKIGEEFDAVVSGVTEWGLFAELDNGVEGMIRVESLGESFEFDESRLVLAGANGSYKLGDKIRIKVDSVNYDKIAFSLAERKSGRRA